MQTLRILVCLLAAAFATQKTQDHRVAHDVATPEPPATYDNDAAMYYRDYEDEEYEYEEDEDLDNIS